MVYKSKRVSRRKSRKKRVSLKKRVSRRKFGYSNGYSPKVYNASMHDGILLGNDAFSWMGNPLARSLMSGSG